MKKLIVILVLICATYVNGWTSPLVPYRMQAVSPDGQWEAKFTRADNMGEESWYWRIVFSNRQTKDSYNFNVRTQDALPEYKDDDSFGLYDFAFSPDSRLILFVFMPFNSSSIGHCTDCIGVLDIETRQFAWVGGTAVNKMQSDLYGLSRLDYRLRWLDNNHVSFYQPKRTLYLTTKNGTSRAKVVQAGTETVNISLIRSQFVLRQQRLVKLMKNISVVMQDRNWRQKIRPYFANQKKADEWVKMLAYNQANWKKVSIANMKYIDYNPKNQVFAVFFVSCFCLKGDKIVDIPWDLD